MTGVTKTDLVGNSYINSTTCQEHQIGCDNEIIITDPTTDTNSATYDGHMGGSENKSITVAPTEDNPTENNLVNNTTYDEPLTGSGSGTTKPSPTSGNHKKRTKTFLHLPYNKRLLLNFFTQKLFLL